MSTRDVVVIGAGHNGLACACYLARAGCRVLVLEMADRIGGAAHTAATIAGKPGYRFDTCSVVHNMINMTTVIEELRLQDVGLVYIETDPFTTSHFPDGAVVRFYRSVERTCDEIARYAPCDAEAYARFIRAAGPITELALGAFRSSGDHGKGIGEWRKRITAAGRTVRRNRPTRLTQQLAGPYGTLLGEIFQTEYARAGIAALAAHGTLGPETPGAAFFVFWQAAYHRYGNWHAQGGSGALSVALTKRLEAWGGTVRTGAQVERIIINGRVRGVELADGERIEATRVVAAINPQTTLLGLVGREHLPTTLARRIATRHRSNAVQFVVHAALDHLPPWPNAPDDGWNGMQSVASSVAQVGENFAQAEAGVAPTHPAAYVFTPSAIDPTVAPPGKHGAYIACASYPARFADGVSWRARGEGEAHRLVAAVEERAPGCAESITGLAWRHAEDWEQEIGLLGGHPLHLDLTLDQLGGFRPLPELASHRGPIDGLYMTGAGTYPTGGVSAVPGRAAARVVLKDFSRHRKE